MITSKEITMKIVYKFGILSQVFLLVACGGGSDDPAPTPQPQPQITAITLTANASETEVGQNIIFTVKANTGATVTSSATIYVNGAPITGSSFTPEVAGNMTATAHYNQLVSNSLVITIKEKPVTSVAVKSDNPWVNLDNSFTFMVEDSNGKDVTEESTLFVNTFEIEGNTFSPNSYGAYNVVAKYDNFTSEALVVNAQEGPDAFTKKVLVEDFTGTWCGWCPRVSYGIELVQNETDHMVVAAIHRGSSDPYHFDGPGINTLDEGIYPTAKINRKETWEYPEPSNVTQVLNHVSSGHDVLGLSIKSTMGAMNVDIDVRVFHLADVTNSKLVVYLVEDHLFFNQTNYTQYYDGNDILFDFEHDNVLRDVLTDLFGDAIPNEESVANSEYGRQFSAKVPASVSNTENLKVIAFVVDASGNVLNVQSAPINTYKNYD
jgi:hypothetical protein